MKTNTQKWSAIALAMLGLFITSQAFANSSAALSSNDAQVTATVSKTDVQIAEPFQLELTVTAPDGARVSLPPMGDQLGEFDVIDTQDIADIPSDASAGQRIWKRRMTLESIVAGDLQIPALDIQVADGAESQTLRALKSLSTQPISVRVLSVLEGRADPTQFRDIQSVVDIKVPQPESYAWVWWTVGAMGTASFVAATIAVVARRKTWLTPAQWAERELDAIQSSVAMQANDSETISRELSTVLRDFLELQFEISAPVQTTQELLSDVNHRKILQPELAKRFSKLFAIADEAKFAGLSLTESQLNKVFDKARSAIAEASQFAPDITPAGEAAVVMTSSHLPGSKSETPGNSAAPNKESV